MTTKGIVYIAYGEKARQQANEAVKFQIHYDYDIISDLVIDANHNQYYHLWPANGRKYWQAARAAKVALYHLTPFDYTLYADADTRITGDISAGFDLLAAGYDLVIVPSQHQGEGILWHLTEEERETTLNECGYRPLQLQAGVFFFRKNTRVQKLFQLWAEEWDRWQGQDQGALTRALHRTGVRVWLMGRPWNGGAVIQHHFGACR